MIGLNYVIQIDEIFFQFHIFFREIANAAANQNLFDVILMTFPDWALFWMWYADLQIFLHFNPSYPLQNIANS